MPVIKAGPYDVEYAEAGSGPTVLLLHSSAAGNRQWRKLMEERTGKNRLVAANLFGYGNTSPWSGERPMRIDDQANLALAVAHFLPERFTLIGHSLGAAVALQAATRLGGRLEKLILFEPILFYLLRAQNDPAYAEIDAVRRAFVEAVQRGDWDTAAHVFIDYWSGPGAWDATADERRARLLPTLPALLHEWTMMTAADAPPVSAWQGIEAPVHVICAADTRATTRNIAAILRGEFPRWHFHEVAAGGHTAPISRPDLVNPVIAEILEDD